MSDVVVNLLKGTLCVGKVSSNAEINCKGGNTRRRRARLDFRRRRAYTCIAKHADLIAS